MYDDASEDEQPSPPAATTDFMTGLEQRLFTFLNTSLGRIERTQRDLSQKLDDVIRTTATKSELEKAQRDIHVIDSRLDAHENSEGHPLVVQRVANLERANQVRSQRPLEVWKVVVAAIGLLTTGCFLLFNFITLLISALGLAHALHWF